MKDKIEQSEAIFHKAVELYEPSAIFMMFSGGDDSLATYHVTKRLNIPITHFVHGRTRTGILETTEFAREIGKNFDYIEADAGNAYEAYVLRKGFFGKGVSAHSFAYHILKASPFRKAGSSIRKRRRNFRILFLCGARKDESANRRKNLKEVYNIDPGAKNNIWVNLIYHWSKEECKEFIDLSNAKRNPVAEILCRSGECMCGTMQSDEQRREAAYWFPKWGDWLDDLEKAAIKKFGFGWGDSFPKKRRKASAADFMPACQNCIRNK